MFPLPWLELVAAASQAEPHHGLTLADGTYRQGYILDYGENWLEWGEAGPLADWQQTERFNRLQIRVIWFSTNGHYHGYYL